MLVCVLGTDTAVYCFYLFLAGVYVRQNLLVVFTDENIKMLSTPVNVYQYITLSVKPHLEPHLTSVCHNKTLASSYSVKPSYHQAPDTDSKTSLSLSRLQLYLCTHLSVLSPRNNPGKTETLCVSQSGPAHKQGDLGCHVLTLRVAPSLECTSAGFFGCWGGGSNMRLFHQLSLKDILLRPQ